jgi:glycolate oxidase
MADKEHQSIYEGLVNILGKDNVSDDKAVMEAYVRDWLPPGVLSPLTPEFVVMPENTKEVQSIYKLANRLKFPIIPVGSNQWSLTTKPNRPRTVTLDSKRLNRILEIDEKNMFMIIEPYVTNAQVSAEAMKYGLQCGCPEAGGQASQLAGHVFMGMWGNGYRVGMGYKNILGFELVFPNGEVLRAGSLSNSKSGWFFGEGPGPDLRGMLRAYLGTMGGYGTVTKLAIKLEPWPGPKEFPCEGITPNQKSFFEDGSFEWVLFTYPTLDAAVNAMYEVGRCEIGGSLHKWSSKYLCWWWAKSGEEHWKMWQKKFFQKNMKNMLSVCLWPFSGKKHQEYEKRVLLDIIKDTGGKLISKEAHDLWVHSTANNWLRDSSGPRMMQPSGAFALFKIVGDTLNVALQACKEGFKWMDKYSPPVLDCDNSDWIVPYDFCHFAIGETDFPYEKTPEDSAAVVGGIMEMIKDDLAHKKEGGVGIAMGGTYHGLAGPVFSNYDHLLRGIKLSIDPNNIANPPHPVPVEE